MEEADFAKLLEQFPRIRGPDYVAGSVRNSTSSPFSSPQFRNPFDFFQLQTAQNIAPRVRALIAEDTEERAEDSSSRSSVVDNFWELLESRAAEKVGKEAAARFHAAFQECHAELVKETLSLDDIARIAGVESYRQIVISTADPKES